MICANFSKEYQSIFFTLKDPSHLAESIHTLSSCVKSQILKIWLALKIVDSQN